ncbi:MAG: tRNA uridine-5-carboxymethylaminomethyl(34) synthesis enzyme MnmG [Bdellovibrionaceae bacterium]|nr:tRNA uridine-5-carboxymethylaminomethyl(34) synthesis enzyme MnmG [Pseudobdellovibrionaceae bacterium]
MKEKDFDVIVVGGGHAGVEACLAAARMEKSVLLITTRIDRLGFMSCNPSIGGLAKGNIVREVDILGGIMGVAADKTCVQFKRLNSKKGPAVRGSRAQCDKDLYCDSIGEVVTNHKNIRVLEAEAKTLVLENGTTHGVVLEDGSEVFSHTVILTTGTFMRGVMHIGNKRIEGGRVGDRATVGISDQLAGEGFKVLRLKTGTPPRLHKDSIDWSKTTPQYGDEKFFPFSFRSKKEFYLPQVACFLSYTNEKTHEIIRNNLHSSPMYSGQIEGLGPRYCPSIEDKVTRFAEKTSHQTFLEPEGIRTDSIYLQGISTSLPEEIQEQFLKTIPGLENVKIVRHGYAVEYDCVEPTQIWPTLETRGIKNLYLAGQINGTSGYEEAAGQGLIAGVNAALKIDNQESFILRRDEAYIGVLIDDLVTKGTREPYRMFTSRAEHRLHLREDNTIERLFDRSNSAGLLDENYKKRLSDILEQRKTIHLNIDTLKISPTETTLGKLRQMGSPAILKQVSLKELLRRNEVDFLHLEQFGLIGKYDEDVYEAVEVEVKYEGYISRQKELIKIASKLENVKIPTTIEYKNIRGLSIEEQEKLSKIQPLSIGQAQRISGVNPSAIQAILIHLKLHREPHANGHRQNR